MFAPSQELQEKRMGVEELLKRYSAGQRDFSNIDLTKANLRAAQLPGVNFRGGKLTKAILCEANLTKANLSGCDLSDADLRGAILVKVNLNRANLSRALLFKANFSGAKLFGANLEQTELWEAFLLSGSQLPNFTLPDEDTSDLREN